MHFKLLSQQFTSHYCPIHAESVKYIRLGRACHDIQLNDCQLIDPIGYQSRHAKGMGSKPKLHGRDIRFGSVKWF